VEITINQLCNGCSTIFSSGSTPRDNRAYCPECQADADAVNRAAVGLRPAPRIRGRFYVEQTLDGWQIVDSAYALTLGCANKTAAMESARFARAYCAAQGDINFDSFPYSLDDPFDVSWLAKALAYSSDPTKFLLTQSTEGSML